MAQGPFHAAQNTPRAHCRSSHHTTSSPQLCPGGASSEDSLKQSRVAVSKPEATKKHKKPAVSSSSRAPVHLVNLAWEMQATLTNCWPRQPYLRAQIHRRNAGCIVDAVGLTALVLVDQSLETAQTAQTAQLRGRPPGPSTATRTHYTRAAHDARLAAAHALRTASADGQARP
ncbi:hypothetical protein EJ04DRAFT_552083 [Polyplosphaeria fusca]|uniref:Uncharacterized protein n=1 Tax=Polyplosphaeria fusca TaxID=682080 RepID=A0A9P4V4G1_9PLEO|nr:hypothetical protein EJ04DRAFT_552083 [Polyplosphaeria fusca]